MKKQCYLLLCFILTAGSKAQFFENMATKAGFGISKATVDKDQSSFQNIPEDIQSAYTVGLEPELLRFGSKKNMAISLDALWAIKGISAYDLIYAQDMFGNWYPSGNYSSKLRLNYISLALNYKYLLSENIYVKLGPRYDIYLESRFDQLPPNTGAPFMNYNFNSACFGITYGAGILLGEKNIRFLLELIGQNDFSTSVTNNNTFVSYTNNAYLLNLGIVFKLKSS